jgi:hypothetical protein
MKSEIGNDLSELQKTGYAGGEKQLPVSLIVCLKPLTCSLLPGLFVKHLCSSCVPAVVVVRFVVRNSYLPRGFANMVETV